MAAKPVSLEDDERQMIIDAVNLSMASCNRLSNRAGQIDTVRQEYLKQAERLAILRNKLTLTK